MTTQAAGRENVLVFINYRREDTAGHAGRLHDDLVRRLTPEQVFMDVAAIAAGEDFVATITEAVGRCTALVALIGPRWLAAKGTDGARRLDDPADFVRLEIEAALQRDVLVIPLLVQDATMPGAADLPESLQPLARRNALQLRDATWRADVEALVAGLARVGAVAGAGLRGHSEAFWTSAPAEAELPYLGLRSFDVDDARFYFGREDDVGRLLDLLRANRFLAVFGPSGSGKSSLVKAGLANALRGGGLGGSGAWPIEAIRPGPRPLETLAARLARLNPRRTMAELVDALAADPRTLHLETVAALADLPPETRLTWIVDQSEELFTLCHDDAERRAAVANLVHAGTVPGGRANVVLAMRADFYQRCAAYPDLAAAISTSQYLVSPMTEAGIRRAIEEPARAVGLHFEPGLVDTIIEDVTSQPGALPLLEHALFELFQRRRGTTMTLEGYRATGGVEGALAKRAESVYDDLPADEQAVVRRVMLRLTQPGEGTVDTRRRSSLRDLPAAAGESGPLQHVISELADARLLTLGASDEGGEPVVEIAHEALIRAWPRVRGWIEDNRAALVVHRRIADAASEWTRIGRSDDALLRGVRLAEALEWRASHADLLNEDERAFLDASTLADDAAERLRERRRRQGLAIATGLLAFFVLLSGAALLAWRDASAALERATTAEETANRTIRELQAKQAELQAKQAELDAQRRVALGRSLIAEARRTGVPFNLQMLLALEGRRLAGNEASELLLGQLHGYGPLVRTRHQTDIGPGVASAISPDGGTLAYVRPGDGVETVVLRDTSTGSERDLATLQPAFGMVFDPTGHILAVSGSDATGAQGVELLDLASSTSRFLPTEVWSAYLQFSADGRRIATDAGATDVKAAVWDVATGAPLFTRTLGSAGFRSIALNHDGSLLAMDLDDGTGTLTTELWDVGSSTRRVISEERNDIGGLLANISFSGTGNVLGVPRFRAVEGADGTEVVEELHFWDVGASTPRTKRVVLGDFHPVALRLAPAGAGYTILGTDSAGKVQLIIGDWGSFTEDVSSGYSLFDAPLADARAVWYGPAGQIVADDGVGAVAEWAIQGVPAPSRSIRLPESRADSDPLAVNLAANVAALLGSELVDGVLRRRVFLVDLTDGTTAVAPGVDASMAVLSADGATLAATVRDGVLIVQRAAEGWQPRRTLPVQFVSSVAISPDGTLVAVATDEVIGGGEVQVVVYELETGREVGSAAFSERPTSIAFIRDRAEVAVATSDGADPGRHTLWTFPASVVDAVPDLIGHGPHDVVIWGGSGATLQTLDIDGNIDVWDADARRLVATSLTTRTAAGAGAGFALASVPRFAVGGEVVAIQDGQILAWPTDALVSPIEERGCDLAGRNLTAAEWGQYLLGEPYAPTCPAYPTRP